MSSLRDRYLARLSCVPLSRENVGKLGRTLLAAWRSKDTAALPAALAIEVSDAAAPGALARVVRLVDEVKPTYVSLRGDEPLRNPELPAMIAHASKAGVHVDVRTDGTLLDAGRAWALLDAGLAQLTVCIDAGDAREKVLRNVEKLIAMRDANRKPGPRVELALRRGGVGQLHALVTLCHARFHDVEPVVVLAGAHGRPDIDAALPSGDPAPLAELRRARALAEGYGFRRTVGSVDAAIVQLTGDLGSAPCYVPWLSAHVAADGGVYPCARHALRGTRVGDVHREPFAETWNGARMRAFRAALRARRGHDPVCATCRHEDGPIDAVFATVAKVPGLGRTSARVTGARRFVPG